jgi:hypothetical protein
MFGLSVSKVWQNASKIWKGFEGEYDLKVCA